MFNFEKLAKVCNDTKVDNIDPNSVLNMYTTQILRNFKPTFSLNLLEIYLQTYEGRGITANNINGHDLDRMMDLYKCRLERFVDNKICEKIENILKVETNRNLVALQDMPYREFEALLNYKQNESCPFQLADNLRRTIMASNNIEVSYSGYYDGPPVKKSENHITVDQKRILKEIIKETSNALAFGDSFEYGEKFDSFISMLFIYAYINCESYSKVYELTTTYDLFKFGNNDLMNSFIRKDSDREFSDNNIKDYQYTDLTTAICICPKTKYNLTIDNTNIKDMKAYNLLRLEMVCGGDRFPCEVRCNS